LDALDHAGVARGAGGAEGVVRPGDTEFSEISPAGLLATVRGLWWCDQNCVS